MNLKKDYLLFLATNRLFFKNKNFLKYFGFIFGLYFIGYFKFLTSDILYGDDYHRNLEGNPDFATASRFFSEFLSHIFHMDYPYLNYNSPLNQLIAIAFLSLASMALVKIVNKKITYFGLIASLCVGLSPFYLDCLSYKYDSPYMALATLCAILPFLFIKRLSLFFITSVIFLLCMWNLYQANNGIYIVLSMFITLNLILENKDKKQIYKFIFISALAFCISVLIYKFGFMKISYNVMADRRNYIEGVTQTITSFNDLQRNFTNFLRYIKFYLGEHFIKILFFTICFLFLIIKFYEKKIKSSIFAIFFIITFLYIGFFATYGLYYLFSELNYGPRMYSGIGVFTAILLINIINVNFKFINSFSKILTVVFSYTLITISISYMNVLIMEKEYLNLRVFNVFSFLQNNKEYKNYKLQFNIKEIGTTKPIANAINSIPIVKHSAKLSEFLTEIHENYGLKIFDPRRKKICKDETFKESIDTKFNKFEIYENCIKIGYKMGDPFIYNASFSGYLIKDKLLFPIIRDYRLNNDLTLNLYNAKKSLETNILIFEFDKNIQKIAQDSDTLNIHIYLKNDDIFLDESKNIKKFKKINGKYYYTVGVGNLTLADIDKFIISFYNKKTDKILANFTVKWKEYSK